MSKSSITNSKEYKDYMQSLFSPYKGRMTATAAALRTSSHDLKEMINGRIFGYERLKRTVEYAGGSMEKIHKIAKKDAPLYYAYWDEINHEKRKDQIGRILKKYRLEKGVSIVEIAEAAGVFRNYVSVYEYGKNPPQYEQYKAICERLGIDEIKTLDELRLEDNRAYAEKELRKKLKDAREENMYSTRNVAGIIGASVSTVEKIEEGPNPILDRNLEKLAVLYNLDFITLLKKAIRAEIIKPAYKSVEDYKSKVKKPVPIPTPVDNMRAFVTEIIKYEYVKHEGILVRSDTFLTTLFLSIIKDKQGIDYELLYFLKNRYVKNELSVAEKEEISNKELSELIKEQREKLGYSLEFVAMMMEISRTKLTNIINSGQVDVLKEGKIFSEIFNIPLSYIISVWLKQYKPEKASRSIQLKDVLKFLKFYKTLTFGKMEVGVEKIGEMMEEIIENEDLLECYEKLKK